MINTVALSGRLTKDPELRKTQNNKSVATFAIAVDRDYKNQDGSRTADFISCVAWEKSAELLQTYCRKGDMIGVEGRVQTRNYQDKNGNRVYVTEVLAHKLSFLSRGKNNQSKPNPTTPANTRPQQSASRPLSSQTSSKPVAPDPFKGMSGGLEITPNDLPF